MEKPLKEELFSDLKEAMKQKHVRKTSVLRMLAADIKNFEIDKRRPASREDVLKILSSSAKKHEDSISQFTAGSRLDLAENEKAELEIIRAYLPAQLDDQTLDKIIAETITEAGALSAADFGKVMKLLMPKIAGRASGQTVSQKLKAQMGN